jgi:glycosyltransferase involved in cell wall biosynthesis
MLPGPNPLGAWRLLGAARADNADVIHSHGYKGNILLGASPRSLRPAPLVATLHGYTHVGGGAGRMRLYQWLDRRVLRRIDRVVLVHREMLANPLLARRRDDRWRVIENGIGPSQAPGPPPDDEIARFCRGSFTIGAVGRLSPEKGFHHLIAALGELVGNGFAARLVILGEGPQRPRLEAQAHASGLTGAILMPGFVVRARDYLPLFGAFVLSSATEGLPVAILEAMQARVPIVATRVGGVPDVLLGGRGGRLVAPGDPSALARAVRDVRENPQGAAEMAAAAYSEVTTRYSSARMARSYLELYREIAAPRRG